jgi:hypothetical protein
MTGIYNLAATPFLFPEGEFKGELKGVTFVATSKADTKQWFTINCGQFETAFSKLIPAGLAKEIIAVLTRGNDIEFPGLRLSSVESPLALQPRSRYGRL